MKKFLLLVLLFFNIQAAQAATLTVYPDPDAETTSVDGRVERVPTTETFATIRAGAGTTAYSNQMSGLLNLSSSATLDEFDALGRVFTLFDTSALGSGVTITSAIISFDSGGTGSSDGFGSAVAHVAGSTPASNTDLVAADFTQIQRTSFGSISFASWSGSGYNNITLNASGLSNISKTGVSKFSAQLAWDLNNSFTGTWAANIASEVVIIFAETAGTTTDPKLAVTYTPPSAASSHKMIIIE